MDNQLETTTPVQFRFIGKKEHVDIELSKQLDRLSYKEHQDNVIVERLESLIANIFLMNSPGTALEVIITIQGTIGERNTKAIELAIRPVWGFCDFDPKVSA